MIKEFIFYRTVNLKIMTSMLQVGSRCFSRDACTVRKSSFGKMYRGRFQDLIDVSIVRIDKTEIEINHQLLYKTDTHPNIARFNAKEESSNDF